MKFTLVTAKSPEKLVEALNAEGKTVDIKTLCGMMWQPHGAVVVVGYEKHVPAAKSETASKKKPRRNLVKELERQGGIGDSGDGEVIHPNSAGDSSGTRAD